MSVQHPYPTLLGEVLAETAARLPDKEALVFAEERVSWSEFDRRVERLARAFLEMGIERGDRIGVISTTRPEYLYTYLAAARVGAVLVGFNVLYTPPELRALAEIAQPVAMVVLERAGDKEIAGPLKPLFDGMSFVEHYVVIGEEAPAGAVTLAALMADERPEQESALAARQQELDQDDGVLIVFTSGSTGVPKGALLTHRNIIENIAVEVRHFDFAEDDRVLLHLPLSHVGGATELSVPALMLGATLVILDRFHPLTTLQTIEKERITKLGQVPTMYIMEFNLPNYESFDLSSLQAAIVAGAATPPPVMAQMMQMAPTVITGYGMTEVAGFVTYTAPDDDAETISYTVGRVASEFELRVVDDNYQEVPVGEVGEVAIRGSCVMKGYFGNVAATEEAVDSEGWFYSGDLGRLDERGYLTLVDRKKEMYISGGYNVYPREVVAHISHHPQVALVAVLGVPDDVMGEVGAAYVVPRPGAEVTAEELRVFCGEGLAEYKIPKRFILCEQLPLTPLGKVHKFQLRQKLTEVENSGSTAASG